MILKRALVMMISCGILLCGCGKTSGTEDNTDGGTASDLMDPVRREYYEQIIGELQAEVLELRSQLYIQQKQYEAALEELEERLEAATRPAEDAVAKASDFAYRLEGGKAVITAYTGEEVYLRIPDTLDGYPVCAVGDRAFENRTNLRTVTLPDSVVSVGWFAFSGCVSLEKISVPASVSAIGYGAFQNCGSALTVLCVSGSYAEQYAQSYGIRTA